MVGTKVLCREVWEVRLERQKGAEVPEEVSGTDSVAILCVSHNPSSSRRTGFHEQEVWRIVASVTLYYF